MADRHVDAGDHGGNLQAAQAQYGRKDFCDLSVNINPWGPPFNFWISLIGNLLNLRQYPQPYAGKSREILGRFFGLSPEWFALGNGAAELIRRLPAVFPVERAVVLVPTFSEYGQAFQTLGKPVIEIALKRDFQLPVADIKEQLKPKDLLFICQPNNPTGGLFPENALGELLCLTKARGCWMVIDESFLWFAGEIKKWSFFRYLQDFPNLILLNSLTKIGSIPGLRLGFLIAEPEMASLMRNSLDQWNVNQLAQKVLPTIIEPKYLRRTRERLQRENSWLQREFAGIHGLHLYPWAANFYLIKLEADGLTGKELIRRLGEKGILVRDCSNFPGLGPEYIRVAVGDRRRNKRFLKELRRILGQ